MEGNPTSLQNSCHLPTSESTNYVLPDACYLLGKRVEVKIDSGKWVEGSTDVKISRKMVFCDKTKIT